MAAGKTSRPKSNMLVGLDNISGKRNHNFINIDEKEDMPKPMAEPKAAEEIKNDPMPIASAVPEPVSEKIVKNELPESVPPKEAEEKPKRKPGRPRKFAKDEHTSVIGVRLLESEIKFLEEYGWKYGGKTGYVTHLIREEMARINK